MKHFTIIGNWKMHEAPDQAVRLAERLQKKLKPHTHVTSVICPPFVSLAPVKAMIERDTLRLGAQNLNEHDEGAFTGEVSGSMLRTLAQYVILGHSERRAYEGETDNRIAQKVAAAIRNGIKPVLCVGEKLNEREAKHSERVVVSQLQACLSQITESEIADVIITYEPVWAISKGDGKGHFAGPAEVEPMVRVIRQTLEELFGEGASSKVEILYGGSANPDNCRAFIEIEHINGLLVGGASLNYDQFAKIVETAGKLSHER